VCHNLTDQILAGIFAAGPFTLGVAGVVMHVLIAIQRGQLTVCTAIISMLVLISKFTLKVANGFFYAIGVFFRKSADAQHAHDHADTQ
jgi:hypothetical protein